MASVVEKDIREVLKKASMPMTKREVFSQVGRWSPGGISNGLRIMCDRGEVMRTHRPYSGRGGSSQTAPEALFSLGGNNEQ